MSGHAQILDSPVKPPSSRSPVARFFSGDNRYLPPLFITLILVVSNLSFGLLESFSRTALAIATSMLVEMALTLLLYRKFPHLASAYITGISVGILVRSPAFWPYALCSAIAITSKYVLRWRGRHLDHPRPAGVGAIACRFFGEPQSTVSDQSDAALGPHQHPAICRQRVHR